MYVSSSGDIKHLEQRTIRTINSSGRSGGTGVDDTQTLVKGQQYILDSGAAA
jgi:hypothetical protein